MINSLEPLRPLFPSRWSAPVFIKWRPTFLFAFLLLVYFFTVGHLHAIDPTASLLDQGIWLSVILGLISFLLILALSWWILQHFLLIMGLPQVSTMVLQFNTLTSWQQLVCYWASFVMLVLVASQCLKALC